MIILNVFLKKNMIKWCVWTVIWAVFMFFSACQSGTNEKSKTSGKLRIVCTTGMIADVVENIVKDSAEVVALMGSGVDPHLYKATQGDLTKLNEADVIIYNGLHLEGKMSDVLEKLKTKKLVLTMAEGVSVKDLRLIDTLNRVYDPHIWFDVRLWTSAVTFVSSQLALKYPAHASYYAENTSSYVRKMKTMYEKTKARLENIPKAERILVTSHDAFGYFGKAYDIEVIGLQGISTVADFGLKDVSNLVRLIIDKKIKAVFIESSVSPKSIEAVVEGCKARGHDVRIGGKLFSDAMGEKNTFEGTYLGMVQTNVEVIGRALSVQVEEGKR
jgi:manganese/zinc/iron transport system substrate-binding protein